MKTLSFLFSFVCISLVEAYIYYLSKEKLIYINSLRKSLYIYIYISSVRINKKIFIFLFHLPVAIIYF